MSDCVVLIPVLARPHRAQPVVNSIISTSDAAPLFLCSPGDDEEIEAVRATRADHVVVPFSPGPGDFARKVNHGVALTRQPLIFLGADDLCFHRGWLEAVRRHLDRPTRGRPAVGVVGTNDMGNRRVKLGSHSTHSLLTRAYVEEHGTIDEPGVALHEGYDHNFVDDELVATAKHRRAWSFAADARVEHLHPDWKKGVIDATYERGKAGFELDRAVFTSRVALWSPVATPRRRARAATLRQR